MFDFHMHSTVSFDAHDSGEAMARAAAEKGLKEICFTDHKDYDPLGLMGVIAFDDAVYDREYSDLRVPGLVIRKGMEFGMLPDNQERFRRDLAGRHYDFVLGSVHFARNLDVYYAPYWEGKTVHQAERQYLEETLLCVRAHEDFDVLAHLNFISKSHAHPTNENLRYEDHREVVDEILRTLVQKGKGLEMNTSGVDRCGGFLPEREFFERFKELGGEIVTVGSDAHACKRVGQYCRDACDVLKEIFGYVCTFEQRQPIFHKI